MEIVKRKGCSCWVKTQIFSTAIGIQREGHGGGGGGGVKGVSKLIFDGSMQLFTTPHTRVAIGADREDRIILNQTLKGV